ncbi:hypothetical protein [Vibrio phage LP.2]|nr:hypothetical protein [Vibrio phage LP.2]
MLYGYDIRSGSAVIFYAHSFRAVQTFDIKDYESWEHMHSALTTRVQELNKSNELLPPLD